MSRSKWDDIGAISDTSAISAMESIRRKIERMEQHKREAEKIRWIVGYPRKK